MMVLLLCHLVQTVVYGAYRAPREVNWLTGVLLSLLVSAFAVTGYLLPWDQKGYWATLVVTTLVGSTPLIGPALQSLVQGGPTYGNLTLTHFFAIHVFLLPATILLFTLLHVGLARRHGTTPRWDLSEEEIARRTEPRWPRQVTYDLAGSLVLLMFLVAWVTRHRGAPLSAPADPSSSYDARPEWYFLPLYQFLRFLPSPIETIGGFLGPLLAVATAAGLPFLDRAASADPRLRKGPLALCGLAVTLALVLGAVSASEDAGDKDFQRGREAADKDAAHARQLALKGVLPAGGVAVYQNDPLEEGRAIFGERCAGCHPLGAMRPAEKDQKGSDLSRFASRAWLDGFLRDPDAPRYFGKTKLHGMKPVNLPEPEMKALVEYVYSLGGDLKAETGLLAAGRKIFEDENCDTCHERDGKTEGEGPNLFRHASAGWVRGLLVDPGSVLYYSDGNDMPSFAKKLSAEELDKVSAFVASQRQAP